MVEEAVADALESLAGTRHSRQDAIDLVPNAPGLYAFHGDATAWSALQLAPVFEGQPLYVGKAEQSLKNRDVQTHFAAGRTGSSTLRRSLAALLQEDLGLVAVPRNLTRPEGTSNFALDAASEQRLSEWMNQRLSLSTWSKPEHVVLAEVETAAVRRLRPPLNLAKVGEPRTRLLDARRRMADVARSWRLESTPPAPNDGFDPPAAPALTGAEPFDGVDASVVDFWRFAMSDLRTNNVRGCLAEFLVARAVGSAQLRVEWDAWDVTAPDGTRIEVKSAGYLQSWAQKKLSAPTFRVAAAYGWDFETNTRSKNQQFHADVYVFCVHRAQTHEDYEPLAASQWDFYVADRAAVEAQAGASMGLKTLMRLVGNPVPYSGLRSAIRVAAEKDQRPEQAIGGPDDAHSRAKKR